MTWRVVSATAIGTSHQTNGTDCQDECWAFVESLGGEDVLTVFVSDGAGSALKGGEGANLAIQAAVRFVAEALSEPHVPLTTVLAQACAQSVHDAIAAEAATRELTPRDYACTLLGVVSRRDSTLVFQIGDGAIVLDIGNGLEVAVEPMTGEYANMTNFVTQTDHAKVLVARVYPAPALHVAAFSDGLQRLALNMSAGTAHAPFFRPFFDVLAAASLEQEDALQVQLAEFLKSKAVNERTDDDKSLALASWIGSDSLKTKAETPASSEL
ncbi:hypothetical protein J2789_007107 [Variovorax paradoxus]|uniref:PP2C family serine/threonine-protein phosphatase n=1 Tax=Variovorax atrisoli TaxID=3394203 RepID=UPI001647212D|nr:PP2C family serine/threonine-protein phosphatase [Variovorax paradoxus]MDR6524396.1 hypothetical protein [Variovorax paradoxus]